MDFASSIKLLTFVGLVAAMLATGLKTPLKDVVSAAKRSRLVGAAIAANFVLVPLATVALLQCFDASPNIAVGFIILAVCPGAPVGPPFAALAKADVPAAVGLMVILAGLSAVLSPVLLTSLIARYLPGDLKIDYLAILRAMLFTQIAPLAIGIVWRMGSPRWAARLAPFLSVLGNAALLIAVVLVIVNEGHTLQEIRLRGWVGMLLILAASLVIGWLCGGSTEATRKTMALTSASRNAAVGLVIVSNSFAGTAAVTAVIAYALVSILGTAVCALLFRILRPSTLP